MIVRTAALAFGLLVTASATAQTQVDLSTLDKAMPGPRAQVLVLGSVHLSNMPRGFKPESLSPVLDRLAAFKPDVITVEQMSGEDCDLVARHPGIYAPEDIRPYCPDTAAAKIATGLDVPAAIAEVHATLKDWPAQPTPAQRRHLAALFLAANDTPSAFVQWLQLPAPERRAGDGLDDALAAQLDKLPARNNESYQIAARMAARLGLQRVYAIDDHTGDNVDIVDEDAYGKAIQQAWDADAANAAPIRKQEQALSEGGDMLALYRFINRSDVLRTAIASDFGAALRDPSSPHYGRLYVAGWEARNLRMVSNIRAAFGDRPGARVLSIVGSSHKPWFDSLLAQMQGVDIVDAEQALK